MLFLVIVSFCFVCISQSEIGWEGLQFALVKRLTGTSCPTWPDVSSGTLKPTYSLPLMFAMLLEQWQFVTVWLTEFILCHENSELIWCCCWVMFAVHTALPMLIYSYICVTCRYCFVTFINQLFVDYRDYNWIWWHCASDVDGQNCRIVLLCLRHIVLCTTSS